MYRVGLGFLSVVIAVTTGCAPMDSEEGGNGGSESDAEIGRGPADDFGDAGTDGGVDHDAQTGADTVGLDTTPDVHHHDMTGEDTTGEDTTGEDTTGVDTAVDTHAEDTAPDHGAEPDPAWIPRPTRRLAQRCPSLVTAPPRSP
jgi:hypothetical protein